MLKRTRSFDWLLFAIFAVYALLYIVEVRGLGIPLYPVAIAVCLVVHRMIIRAGSLREAVAWVGARPLLAFFLIFAWLTPFVQIGWVFWHGQMDASEALGGYLLSAVILSTQVLLGYLLVSLVGKLLASLR